MGRVIVLGLMLMFLAFAVTTCGDDADDKPVENSQSNDPKTVETPKGRVALQVVQVRLEPFRTATGIDTKMVYVDWKNTGDRPIRVVESNITVDGKNITGPSYTIYAEFNNGPGIAPGETFRQPEGRGFVVPPRYAKGTTANVKITVVKEHSEI